MSVFKKFITDVPDFPIVGVNYKDISPLLSSKYFNDVIFEMGSMVKTPEYWVGIDARGFLFAGALATVFQGGVVMCRKQGKLPPPVEKYSYALEYGEDVLEIKPGSGTAVIVDDVYATGGTMSAVEKLCEKAGYTVIDKICLIDLLYLHDDIKCKSLIQYE